MALLSLAACKTFHGPPVVQVIAAAIQVIAVAVQVKAVAVTVTVVIHLLAVTQVTIMRSNYAHVYIN